jgi:hypothetical protein
MRKPVENRCPMQIGFISGNRTADHILTLKTLHDKYVKQSENGKINARFVDLKKVFDSIWHKGLYLKLLENEIGGCFYKLINSFSSGQNVSILSDVVLNANIFQTIHRMETEIASFERGELPLCHDTNFITSLVDVITA